MLNVVTGASLVKFKRSGEKKHKVDGLREEIRINSLP